MKRSSNFSHRGQIILEELFYAVAMLSLIFFIYTLRRVVESRINEYVCIVSLNKFLRDIYTVKDFFENFHYVEIGSENAPYIFSRKGEICCKYFGAIRCVYIREDIEGVLSKRVYLRNGTIKMS